MNKKVIILLCLFILSRIVFINPLPAFFDSPEYLSRFLNPNYFLAITSGHMPFHAGYILLFWPMFYLASLIKTNPPFMVIFAQIIFSAIAIFCFYHFVKIITNNKIAVIAAVISSLTPLFWIMNVSIMAESTYINFFLMSLFFITTYVKNKIKSSLYLTIGCVLFGLALLTNPLVALWTPLLLYVVYSINKKRFIAVLSSILLIIILIILINGFFISNAFHIPLQSGLFRYLFGEDIKVAPDISSTVAMLRFIRNAFIPTLQNNTAIIFIISIISLIKTFKYNKKLFMITFLWILPAIITYQWFDPLLFGRHGSIAGFGLAFLVGIFLERKRILFCTVIAYLIVVSLPALALLKQPIPYIEVSKFAQTLPNGLLIETHFARPQIERYYSGKIIFINQPGWNKEKLEEEIDSYLSNKQPIFITSQALSDPYGVYSGPFLYPLSLSYIKKFELEDVISAYTLKRLAVINKDAGLEIYKIISKEKSEYPNTPILRYNRRRIDYFDPIIQLWFFIQYF